MSLLGGYNRAYRPIVGLSGKARAGKNAACEFIATELGHHGITTHGIGFADGVKDEARELHHWNGEKDVTGRTLLQNIGMERRKEDPLYWVKRCFRRISENDTPWTQWVVTDVRFINEAEAIHSIGGRMWRVERLMVDGSRYDNGLTTTQQAHPSEVELDGYTRFDETVGAATLDDLQWVVEQAAMGLLTREDRE